LDPFADFSKASALKPNNIPMKIGFRNHSFFKAWFRKPKQRTLGKFSRFFFKAIALHLQEFDKPVCVANGPFKLPSSFARRQHSADKFSVCRCATMKVCSICDGQVLFFDCGCCLAENSRFSVACAWSLDYAAQSWEVFRKTVSEIEVFWVLNIRFPEFLRHTGCPPFATPDLSPVEALRPGPTAIHSFFFRGMTGRGFVLRMRTFCDVMHAHL
jgi:hypothetical protein